MGMEEERHALWPQVSLSILDTVSRVNLGVSVEVTHALHVHHDQLMTRPFEGEVAECLCTE